MRHRQKSTLDIISTHHPKTVTCHVEALVDVLTVESDLLPFSACHYRWSSERAFKICGNLVA